MKPLNKNERWFTFLMIVYVGDDIDKLPFNHINFGYMAECRVSAKRDEEIEEFARRLWENPPKMAG
jgi:hypothetical protein